jgi:natural product precursor
MKKLNKLQINSEKIMKNEELLTLRGGYDCNYYCWVFLYDGTPAFQGVACGESGMGSEADCNLYWNPRGA